MIQPTLINLHSNEYNQEFNFSSCVVKSDRCVGSCNTLNNLSNKVRVPSKTEDLNLSILNVITEINESKTSTKHNHANVNLNLMKRSVIKINGLITINVAVSFKNIIYVKKIICEILLHVAVKMENI